MSAVLEAEVASLAAPAVPLTRRRLDHLEWLESEAIYILREVAAQCSKPALLFSGGKDSCVVLRLAEKAFRPARLPFPLLHIDTGHNFPEVIDFRDERVVDAGRDACSCVRWKTASQAAPCGCAATRIRATPRRSVTLLEAIEELGLDALIGGARRDEEKARAKERIFSFRDSFGQWDPKNQRPELWDLYNARVHPGEHLRVFPISNWTELDVWQYIAREQLPLPSLYYAHRRDVVQRRGLLVPVTALTPPNTGETVECRSVRFRTVGDISCTCPVASEAQTVRGDHRRDRACSNHRAWRHPHGRPDQRSLDGATQAGRIFLSA